MDTECLYSRHGALTGAETTQKGPLVPRRTLSHSDTSPSAARPAEPSPRAQSMPCTSSPAPGSNLPEKRPRRPGCCIRFPLLPLASKRCWARWPETASHQRPRRTRSPFAPSPRQPPCSPAAGAFLEPCPGRCPSPTTSSCGLSPHPTPLSLLALHTPVTAPGRS